MEYFRELVVRVIDGYEYAHRPPAFAERDWRYVFIFCFPSLCLFADPCLQICGIFESGQSSAVRSVRRDDGIFVGSGDLWQIAHKCRTAEVGRGDDRNCHAAGKVNNGE